MKIYENKYCKIYWLKTIFVLHSKTGKYPDKYFNSAEEAYKAIGLDMYNLKR